MPSNEGIKELKAIKVETKYALELPFWLNLRKGKYPIRHFNYLKTKLRSDELYLLKNLDEFITYPLFIDPFEWKIGFDHIKSFKENLNEIIISEEVENEKIISEDILRKYFGNDKDKVHYQKLRTVIHSIPYKFEIQYDPNKQKNIKKILNPFINASKEDFLFVINEFIEFYLAYLSNTNINNEAILISKTDFSPINTQFKI
ncbi:MAG: hypothetical protein ACTSVV_11105, partial [Promethearchaeota archaeon]